MTENKKSTEERKKEIEKQKTEGERRMAVAEAKLAGKRIEDIDKLRKSPSVLSLLARIKLSMGMCKSLADSLVKKTVGSQEIHLTYFEVTVVKHDIDSYKSVREDFKDVADIKDEKFKKLFPERNTYFESTEQAIAVLLGIIEQEIQMSTYLSRKR